MPEWLLIALGIVLLMMGIFFLLIIYQIWRIFKTIEETIRTKIHPIFEAVAGIVQETRKIMETFEKNITKFNNVVEGVETQIKSFVSAITNTLSTIKLIPWETLSEYVKSLFGKRKKSRKR